MTAKPLNITSKWNDTDIRDRAQYLRTGQNKGVRAAVREVRRIEAKLRDEDTPPERRRSARRDEEGTGA